MPAITQVRARGVRVRAISTAPTWLATVTAASSAAQPALAAP